jgi:4-amino-4-deoxy-L-arabinose transferase-like glycosyltransferase
VREQAQAPVAVIPPTRVTFIATSYFWRRAFGTGSIASLRAIACLGSVLTLLISILLIYRARGETWALGFAALMSFAPMQIQAAQRAYIDGFFTFIATSSLWLLWEHLRKPDSRVLSWCYGGSLALLVLTKENAVFVFIGIAAILLLHRSLTIGRLTRSTIMATLAGPAIGVLILAIMVGGPSTLIRIFQLNIGKAYQTAYVVQNGDGPWFRYILDLIEMSPVTTLLAIGGLVQFQIQDPLGRFFAVFLLGSYLIMANMKFGMSLRYAEIWDAPLRWLALLQVVKLGQFERNRRHLVIAVTIAVLCLTDLRQYDLYFVQNGVYDPAPREMLQHLNILK